MGSFAWSCMGLHTQIKRTAKVRVPLHLNVQPANRCCRQLWNACISYRRSERSGTRTVPGGGLSPCSLGSCTTVLLAQLCLLLHLCVLAAPEHLSVCFIPVKIGAVQPDRRVVEHSGEECSWRFCASAAVIPNCWLGLAQRLFLMDRKRCSKLKILTT